MKKYIFTESQVKKIIDSQVSNQVNEGFGLNMDKFPFVFNDGTPTYFTGEIKRDGYLYATSETPNTYKIGPLTKVPFVGQCGVKMVKVNGKTTVTVQTNKTEGTVQFVPNFTSEKIK
jgi:hypothetical protein